MTELTIEKPVTQRKSALDKFCYESGYSLVCSNWGSEGVKLELVHPYEGSRAIILPPEKVLECVGWLTNKLELGKPLSPPAAARR
jgi:hypothetical protein